MSIQITFLYPILLCSRTFIEPTLLFNRLARAIFSYMSHCTQVTRIKNSLSFRSKFTFLQEQRTNLLLNYFTLLSHWTKTFSYDFRNSSLMNQLECVTNQIVRIDPVFKPNVKLLLSEIMAKVNRRLTHRN